MLADVLAIELLQHFLQGYFIIVRVLLDLTRRRGLQEPLQSLKEFLLILY